MIIMSVTIKALPWAAVGGSGIIASVNSWDSGAATVLVGAVGMTALGIIFEYRRRKLDADKLEAAAISEALKIEAIAKAEATKITALAEAEATKITALAVADRERIMLEAKNAHDKLALESQIQLDIAKEKAYAGTLTDQLRKLQTTIDQQQAAIETGNKRTEEANQKLHDLKNTAQNAVFERDALMIELKNIKDRHNDLVSSLKETNSVVNELKTGSQEIKVPIELLVAKIKDNTEVTKQNTEAMDKQ